MIQLMNPFNGAVNVHYVFFHEPHIVARRWIAVMSGYQNVEIVGEQLVKDLEVGVGVHGKVESHERHRTRRHRVDGH
jgi:hypothetical protein